MSCGVCWACVRGRACPYAPPSPWSAKPHIYFRFVEWPRIYQEEGGEG
jgi:hypothetical protein